VIVPSLERDASGKLRKQKLRDGYLERAAARAFLPPA
jgi:hypothetical protein